MGCSLPGRNGALTFRAKNQRFRPLRNRQARDRALELPRDWGRRVQGVLHQLIEGAEPAATRLAARVADAPAVLAARLHHACLVADALLRLFANELRAVTIRLVA